MTLAQVRGYSQALGVLDTERLRRAALAARAGGADEKSFRAWLRSLEG